MCYPAPTTKLVVTGLADRAPISTVQHFGGSRLPILFSPLLSLFVLVGGSIVMVVWLGLRASSSALTCDILAVVDDARLCACSVRLPVLLLAFTLRASQVATEILDAR